MVQGTNHRQSQRAIFKFHWIIPLPTAVVAATTAAVAAGTAATATTPIVATTPTAASTTTRSFLVLMAEEFS